MCAYKVAYFGLPLFVYPRYGCISEYVKADFCSAYPFTLNMIKKLLKSYKVVLSDAYNCYNKIMRLHKSISSINC